jgi:hypothetical protein
MNVSTAWHPKTTHPDTMKLRRMLPNRLGASIAFLALVNACSPAPIPISRSLSDPSSPQAPEGATRRVAATAAYGPSAPSSEAHEHHRHDAHVQAHGEDAAAGATDAGAQAAAYVCPMHPEVTSSAPGVCPKCNMKLVAKK